MGGGFKSSTPFQYWTGVYSIILSGRYKVRLLHFNKSCSDDGEEKIDFLFLGEDGLLYTHQTSALQSAALFLLGISWIWDYIEEGVSRT